MHTTHIKTEPVGADITINGQYQGASPVRFHDRSGIPKMYYFKISKRGYREIETSIEQVYKADLSLLLLVVGIFPYFFSATLEDEYVFKLQP